MKILPCHIALRDSTLILKITNTFSSNLISHFAFHPCSSVLKKLSVHLNFPRKRIVVTRSTCTSVCLDDLSCVTTKVDFECSPNFNKTLVLESERDRQRSLLVSKLKLCKFLVFCYCCCFFFGAFSVTEPLTGWINFLCCRTLYCKG